MPENTTITIPTDLGSWIALLLLVLPFVAQLITALIIRRRPALSSDDRSTVSTVVSFLVMLLAGWPALVGLGYLHFDLIGLGIMFPACLTIAGGKEVVYRVFKQLWLRITTVPPAPDALEGGGR